MRKYLQVYKTSLQYSLAYRGPIIIYRISNFLWLVVLAAAWLASDTLGKIGGFTKGEILTYYLVAMVISPLITWYPVSAIREQINESTLSTNILPKPLSHFWYMFFWEFGWHSISPLFGLLTVIFALLIFGHFFTWTLTPLLAIPFVLATAFSAFLLFGISYCLGLSSFWFSETEGISGLLWMGMFIFGGQGLPISFFPENLKRIVELLPFRYTFSFPLEIFTNSLDTTRLMVGFAFQIGWLILFWLLGRFLWRQGTKVYSSYGG